MRRTWIRTPDGVMTGGNVVYQRAERFEALAAMLEKAYLNRKNPLFMARLIGVRNVGRFLAQRLSLAEMGVAVSKMCGVECRVVVTPFAELGADVDRPEDLMLARSRLRPPAGL